MILYDKLKSLIKILKITSLLGGSGFFVYYHINQSCNTINRVVNPNVLEREKKYIPEYIYIDDPSYSIILELEQAKESQQSVGFSRLWKFLKHSLAWRLLWLCKHGNRVQRDVALHQLASFKNNKNWDCHKLAQALDRNTAVLLARTRGADLRYFLPPPIHVRRAALTPELMSFKLKELIVLLQAVHPHGCIEHFLSKYFANVQEQAMEADSIPTKPDSISERDLCLQCLDAIHHHISLFHNKNYKEDISAMALINNGLLPKLAELQLRNKNDLEIDSGVLKILTVLSIHTDLLKACFEYGMIGQMARLIRSQEVRLSSSAAVCLANLSGEFCYRPGLYLLHPLYRTRTPPACDTLLVHGLRGGVFVTWRQRDRKCCQPLGIVDVALADDECNFTDEKLENKFLDPELQQVMEDIIEIEEERLLSEYEVVLRDIPIGSKGENVDYNNFTSNKKRLALKQENQDNCDHTFCWPKDWLPQDFSNLRILGVNYWTSLSEWLERCPLQAADIASRASEMAPALIDAGVGTKQIPVVWLAHSMGGLIVKQLLIESAQSEDENLKKLSENTKAILFYSTPHRGSSLATMPRAAAAILWPSTDVRQLQVNSPVLLEIHRMFLEFADKYDWETISFAETMPTLVTAFKVPIHFVELFSSDLGRGVFYQLPLDHLTICKPATRQSILYTSVLDVIERVTAKEIKLNYYNSYIQLVLDLVMRFLWTNNNEVIENVDETPNVDGLRWFDRMLLDAFTDGFTD